MAIFAPKERAALVVKLKAIHDAAMDAVPLADDLQDVHALNAIQSLVKNLAPARASAELLAKRQELEAARIAKEELGKLPPE